MRDETPPAHGSEDEMRVDHPSLLTGPRASDRLFSLGEHDQEPSAVIANPSSCIGRMAAPRLKFLNQGDFQMRAHRASSGWAALDRWSLVEGGDPRYEAAVEPGLASGFGRDAVFQTGAGAAQFRQAG